MRPFVNKIILFSSSALLIYITSIIAIGSVTKNGLGKNFVFPLGDYGHTLMRLREARVHSPVDILVLGSSHAYRGFDPRIFEQHQLQLFNLGMSSQTPLQSYYLLKKYYPILQPKFVIQEIFPLLLENDGTESNSFLLANEPISNELTKLAFHQFNMHNFNCWVYGSFRNLFHLNDQITLSQKFKDDTYVAGGYSQKDLKPFSDDDNIVAREYAIRNDQLAALDSIKKFCAQKNCQLYFVITPVTSIEKHHIQNWSSIVYEIEKIHPVSDFSYLPNLVDTLHFYDNDHMNQKGVEIFNPILIERIFK
jgi:gamma-glutamylcyclotransferase (GGCT)/AIG2-like uncharacterized protein YtfP